LVFTQGETTYQRAHHRPADGGGEGPGV